MAERSYLSEFDGATTDDILTYAKNGKTGQVNEKVASYEQSGVKGYVDQMKGQTTVSDADTVQVFDTNGVPHKIAKTELLKKSAQALPTISDISAFIALNKAGNAIGLMSIEETAKVVGELIGEATKEKAGFLSPKGYKKIMLEKNYTNKLIHISSLSEYENSILLSVGAVGASGIFAISLASDTDYTRIRHLAGVITPPRFDFYQKQDVGLFIKSNNDSYIDYYILSASCPNALIMEESEEDISSMTKLEVTYDA